MGKVIAMPARRIGKTFARQTVIGVDPGHPDGDITVISDDGKVQSVKTEPRRGDYLRGIPGPRRTIAQRRELAMIEAAETATDEKAKAWWYAQADRLAVGERAPIPAGEAFAREQARAPAPRLAPTEDFDARHRPVSLVPWLILGVLVAWAIAVTPVWW
ncbi:MAG: hypothetical protein ACTHLA_01645 [Asticcacaulis sp.]|uniref:hypothetical protein n=1 Tax=Asticcacaulis sp. TaxID=1872648 RepID=UPI003F7BE7A3